MCKFAIAFITLLLSTSGYSQDNISLGIKAGVNFASATGDASDSNSQIGYDEGRTGFHVGVISELSISNKFSLQTELLYSQVGANYSYDNRPADGAKVDSDLNLDYITLPILAKYYVYKGLSLLAGPQLGYIVNSEIENEILTSGFLVPETLRNETIDIKDDINNFDFGFAIGSSYELNNGLFIQARYVLGLSEIPKNEEQTISTDLKNEVFQVSLGYKF